MHIQQELKMLQFTSGKTTTRELSVNRIDLQASTLVGLPRQNQDLDPQAVPRLDNRLNICAQSSYYRQV